MESRATFVKGVGEWDRVKRQSCELFVGEVMENVKEQWRKEKNW